MNSAKSFKILLSKKFELFRKLINHMVEHDLERARITTEQACRVAMYAHETYFRHLRLYDFVFTNAKMSEMKRINISVEDPRCGQDLSQAMMHAEETNLES